MKNKLIYLLLSLLGLATACGDKDKDDDGGTICMYGTPTVTFSVKGRVTDPAGKPIEGICVKAKHDNPKTATNARGEFAFDKSEATSFGDIPLKIPLVFEDVDGAQNGSFEDREMEVTFTRNEAVETGVWYRGDFKAPDIDVVLKAKTEPETQE